MPDAGTPPPTQTLLPGGLEQSLIQIADQIVGILDPDGKPQHVWPGPGGDLLFGRQLPMGGGGRMDDQ